MLVFNPFDPIVGVYTYIVFSVSIGSLMSWLAEQHQKISRYVSTTGSRRIYR